MMVLMLLASTAHALDWEMPLGRWSTPEKEVSPELIRFDILKEKKLTLSIVHLTTSDEKPSLFVEGRYQMTITKFSDYHCDVKIDSLELQGVFSGKGKVQNKKVSSSTLFGVPIKRGDTLPFTFSFDCADGKNTVQLCLHTHDHASCRNLERVDPSCKGRPAAIDGSLINPPVNLDQRK